MEQGIKEEGQALGVNAWQVGPTTADPAEQVRAIEDLIAKKSMSSGWFLMMPKCWSPY